MKIRDNYVLKNTADTWVVIPLGDDAVDVNRLLTLNDSGALLWRALESGADRASLISAMTEEYDVGDDVAATDVDAFIDALIKAGCIEE